MQGLLRFFKPDLCVPRNSAHTVLVVMHCVPHISSSILIHPHLSSFLIITTFLVSRAVLSAAGVVTDDRPVRSEIPDHVIRKHEYIYNCWGNFK